MLYMTLLFYLPLEKPPIGGLKTLLVGSLSYGWVWIVRVIHIDGKSPFSDENQLLLNSQLLLCYPNCPRCCLAASSWWTCCVPTITGWAQTEECCFWSKGDWHGRLGTPADRGLLCLGEERHAYTELLCSFLADGHHFSPSWDSQWCLPAVDPLSGNGNDMFFCFYLSIPIRLPLLQRLCHWRKELLKSDNGAAFIIEAEADSHDIWCPLHASYYV